MQATIDWAAKSSFHTAAFFRVIPFKGTDFSGRSDYGPFIAVGIPSGGLRPGSAVAQRADDRRPVGGGDFERRLAGQEL